jgi:hypothetical protein
VIRRALRAVILAGALVALASPARAQSPATQASVASIILQNLPTNGQEQITAANVRSVANALNSAIFQTPLSTPAIIGTVNLNSVADTPFSFFLPNGFSNYAGGSLRLYNCSASASSASVAVYTGAGATGFALVAPTAVTITTPGPNAANTAQNFGSVNTAYSNTTSLFLRVTVAQGSPVTCSAVYNIGAPLP